MRTRLLKIIALIAACTMLCSCATNSALSLIEASKSLDPVIPGNNTVDHKLKGRAFKPGKVEYAEDAIVESMADIPNEAYPTLLQAQVQKAFLSAALDKGERPVYTVKVVINRLEFTEGTFVIPTPSILHVTMEISQPNGATIMRGEFESRYMPSIPVIVPGVVGIIPTGFEGQEWVALRKIVPAMSIAITRVIKGLQEGKGLDEIKVYPEDLQAGGFIMPDSFLRGEPYGISELTSDDITAATSPSHALIQAVGHDTNPDWTGSITEYRDYITANDLQRVCQGHTIASFTLTWRSYEEFYVSKEMQDILKKYLSEYCVGYIDAIAEAYDGGLAKGGWRFCLPKDVSNNQIRENVLGYIEKHQEIAKHSAVSVITHSLNKAFACRTVENKKERKNIDTGTLKLDCGMDGKGSCIGYIQGVTDAYDNWVVNGEKKFCGVGYRHTRATWQVLYTLLKWHAENGLKDRSALDIVTETIAHTCDYAIERNKGCREVDSCKD